VVTDPPYELGFMGKAWDGSGVAYDVDLWAEVLRVLKPGGHLCAFGGTRTYHRMACAIEDAGFEIRDSLHWVYGSGFPKSLDVSKAIDKTNGEPDRLHKFTAWMRTTGFDRKKCSELVRPFAKNDETAAAMTQHYYSDKQQPAIPTAAIWQVIRPHIAEVPDWVDELVARIEAEREVVGVGKGIVSNGGGRYNWHAEGTEGAGGDFNITTAATDAAKQWEGWGTALKPAHEPIVLARRPLIGTVAANVLTHGTGALNIDGARVGTEESWSGRSLPDAKPLRGYEGGDGLNAQTSPSHTEGRWPANVIFDTEAGALLDEQSGVTKDGVAIQRNGGGQSIWGADNRIGSRADAGYGGQGGASRFFTAINWEPEVDVPFRYVPKPSKRERNAGLDGLPEVSRNEQSSWVRECGVCGCRFTDPTTGKPKCEHGDVKFTPPSPTKNHHPTVKPLALMRWLVKLVTPPGGTVLEPFAGSGTTLMACVMEGYDAIGIELTDEYLPIIRGRVAWAEQQPQQTPDPTEHVQETLPL
jgi:site-specific DNA-methyltransferase (adenine-specific)